MITEYRKKAYITGNIIEVYKYSKPQRRGLSSTGGSRGAKLYHTEKQASSIARSKKAIRRLINSNRDLSKFYTLTFAENVKDLTVAHYEFKKFMQKLKRRHPKMKYVAVPEFQKRGAVHYHLLCNLPFVSVEQITELWGNGFVWINHATNLHNVGGYLAKYIKKGSSDKRLYSRRTYMFSLNLERAVEILDKLIDKYFQMLDTKPRELCSFTFQTVHSKVKFSMLCLST